MYSGPLTMPEGKTQCPLPVEDASARVPLRRASLITIFLDRKAVELNFAVVIFRQALAFEPRIGGRVLRPAPYNGHEGCVHETRSLPLAAGSSALWLFVPL